MQNIKANLHIKGENDVCNLFKSIVANHIIDDINLPPILIYCSSKNIIAKKVVQGYEYRGLFSTSNKLSLKNDFFDFYIDNEMALDKVILNLKAAVKKHHALCSDNHDNIKNKLAIQGSRIGVWYWNIQTGETCFDERWAEIIGYTTAEISPISIDTWIKFAHPDDLKKSNKLLSEHFDGKTEYYDFQLRMRHKNNSWVWVHDRGKVFGWDKNGKPLHMCGSHTDITQAKEMELKMSNSIREKDLLLGEIHHRVKNNLQLMQSILRLKSFESIAKIDMEEVEHTIHTLAAAHDAIYRAKDLLEINLNDYFMDIIKSLHPEKAMVFNIHTVPISLDINKLIPIGLIVMEAINNSLKHAFQKINKKKLISLRMNATRNQISLTIEDNGKGFVRTPKRKTKGHGIDIIKSLADQIDAKVSFMNKNGAKVILIFDK